MSLSRIRTALGSAALLVACVHPVSQPTLGQDLQTFWRKTSNRPDDLLSKELFHLAFPGPHTVGVWHLQGRPSADGSFSLLSEDGTPIDIVGGSVRMVRYDSNGLLRSQEPISSTYLAERIEFQGLKPDTGYIIQLPNQSRLVARTRPENTTPDRSSFLAFSCNNPYSPTTGGFKGAMEPAKLNSLKLLQQRADGTIGIKGWKAPSFAMGLGDQVYMDGDNGHGEKFSLFQGNRSSPVFPPAQAADLIDTVYRAHFAMPHFSDALGMVPGAFVWDDHDAHDGFGTNANSESSHLRPYISQAREAFLSYQWLRGPGGTHPRPNGTMDVGFSWGNQIQALMLDTRTSGVRGISWKLQLERVQGWLNALPQGAPPTLFVLGLPAPISIASHESFLRKHVLRPLVEEFSFEAADDLEDMWVSKQEARQEIFNVLQTYFMARENRQHRLLIVSGDVHFSGINYLSTGRGSPFHTDPRGRIDESYRPQKVACRKSRLPQVDDPKARDEEEGQPLDDDVLWGWEVISSGLTNSTSVDYFRRFGLKQGTISNQKGDSLVTAWPRGAIYGSPSFAEFLVEKSAANLQLGVVFYPSQFDDELVNTANTIAGDHELGAYDPVEGSKKMDSCTSACPLASEGKLTRIPLDWDCIPDTHTGNTVYSCIHACSVITDKTKKSKPVREE